MSIIENTSFQASISTLKSVHIFNDVLKYVLNNIDSNNYECQIHYKSVENCGPHWNGYRCFLMDRKDRYKYYLHIGLIYLPETKKGIMVELDKKSNQNKYMKIRSNIKSKDNYTVNRDEKDYLKLFISDDKFEELNNLTKIEKQVHMLQKLISNMFNAIIKGGRFDDDK